jgi:Domain of Unknown Function (DUF1080)
MRLAIALLLTLALACFSQEAPPNTLTPDERAAGWQLLFDGKTLAGWEDPSLRTPPGDSWTIEDGCIKAVGKPRIREDLMTTAAFRDFEMVFDWRIAPGSNSGLKYLIQRTVFLDHDKLKLAHRPFEENVGWEMEHHFSDRSKLAANSHGEEYVVSFEYQLVDNDRHPDARRGAKYQTGSLYGMIAPTQPAARPVGEFNHSRLVVRGSRVEHWLNGVKVVDASLDSQEVLENIAKRWKLVPAVYDLLTRRPRRDCPIGLQNHGDTVWFRDLKIRRLS